MVASDSRFLHVVLISTVFITPAAARSARQTLDDARAPEVRTNAASPANGRSGPHERWTLVHIPDPVARRATVDALETASARFGNPDCRQILHHFADRDGRSLDDALKSLGVDIETYLTMVVFIDDTRHAKCASGVLAFTAPGSRVVQICVEELKRIAQPRLDYIVATFIHEILHTLGLGENPPSSKEITARVLARCRPA